MAEIDALDTSIVGAERNNPLEDLRAILIGEHTIESILGLLATLSHRAFEGAVAASITVRFDDQPFTSNHSNSLALELDNFQYAVGRGPCVEALEKGIQVFEAVADHQEWGDFRSAALEAGITSVLATPLSVKNEVFGALNIYGSSATNFDAVQLFNASAFAEHAGIVLTNVMAVAGAESINVQLREALETRDVIGQAKGILMERQSVTSGRAFEQLRKTSQRTNTKLFDVAWSWLSVSSSGGPCHDARRSQWCNPL